MNTKLKKTLITLATTLSAILIVSTATYAVGALAPSDPVGSATQYTLNDIYTKLTTGTATSTKSGLFTTPEGTPTASFRTLTEIYDAIPTIDATKVATGTTYLGVTGTMQGLSAPLIWQTDPGLSLCWSAGQYETSNGCTIGNGLTAEGYGAVEYCQNLVAEYSSDWRLPTRAEFASITDDSIYNNATQVPGFAQDKGYWSSTPYAEVSEYTWYWYTFNGLIYVDYRYGKGGRVRCVR